ncbi:MAG: hypothetical protein MR406_08295 [Blautia sp.]|nr:hypothetical protein [Blautia sp.]MDD7729277.1 hypothetical protein [Clostridia bacterium]MDY5664351.1 hypothetical protein [Blautia sp.]
MNKEQKEVLSLLTEIDKICRKHGITYFLSPQLTLCSVTGQPFPGNPNAGVVYMKIGDMEQFRLALEQEMPERRILESMNNNKRFPGFFLRYTNMDTLDFRLNEGRNFRYPGIGVNILPLRGKISSRFRHLWNRVEEVGWIEMGDFYGDKRGKKKFLCRMFMRLRCITGRARLGRSLYRHFCKRQDVENTGEYVLRLKKKAVYFPRETFEAVRKVKLEGKTFCAPENLELYLAKYYGKEYRTKVFEKYIPKSSEMVSALVSYEDYFQEVGSQKSFIKKRNRARRKDTYGKNRRKYLTWCWNYAKFCGFRIELERYYLEKKDYIENLYRNKDYPALEEIFAPYTKAMVKSLKNNEIFAPDEELLEIFLDVLEKTGRTALKDRVEKFWR